MYPLWIYAIVQGVTEAFPVSSSFHLMVLNHILYMLQDREIDMLLHMGTLGALIAFFFSDLISSFRGFFKRFQFIRHPGYHPGEKEAYIMVISTLPAALVGWILHHTRTTLFFGIRTTAIVGMISGVILWSIHRTTPQHKDIRWKDMSLKHAWWIGCLQVLAFFPGVSRLTTGIVGARMLCLPLKESILFSLWMGMGSIGGSTLLALRHITDFSYGTVAIMTVITGAISFLCFHIFLRYASTLNVLVIYRILMAVWILSTMT